MTVLAVAAGAALFVAGCGGSKPAAMGSPDGGSGGSSADASQGAGGGGGGTGGGVAGTGGGSAGTGGGSGTGGRGGATGGAVGSGGAASTGGRGGAAGTGGRGGGGGYIPCASPTPVMIGGQDTGLVRCGSEVYHRARAVDCPSLLPRANGACMTGVMLGAAPEPCTTDADCTVKPLGYCTTVPTGHYPACGCVYGCTRDSDCAAGEICECGDPVGLCRAASCTDDSACPGSLCASAALGWGGCSFYPPGRGYDCQAPADTCLSGMQCASPTPACAFASATGTRACHEGQLLCP